MRQRLNLVFDLDGTLIDSAPDIQAAANDLLQSLDRTPLSIEDTRRFVGEGSSVFVDRMMAERSIERAPGRHAELLQQFVQRLSTTVHNAEFYAGVPGLLGSLMSDGYPLAICTNKPEPAAKAVVIHMALDRVFPVVIGGATLPRKPAPDMLLAAIEQLGGGPALYVGDSGTDALTAQAAGVPFAFFTGGYNKTPLAEVPRQWTFDCFDEFPAVLRQAETRAPAE